MSATEQIQNEQRVTELCTKFNKARHQIWNYLKDLESRISQ